MTIIKIIARILRAIMTLLACLSVMLFFGEVNAYSDGIIEVLDFLKNLCYNTYITKKGKWFPHKRKRCYL